MSERDIQSEDIKTFMENIKNLLNDEGESQKLSDNEKIFLKSFKPNPDNMIEFTKNLKVYLDELKRRAIFRMTRIINDFINNKTRSTKIKVNIFTILGDCWEDELYNFNKIGNIKEIINEVGKDDPKFTQIKKKIFDSLDESEEMFKNAYYANFLLNEYSENDKDDNESDSGDDNNNNYFGLLNTVLNLNDDDEIEEEKCDNDNDNNTGTNVKADVEENANDNEKDNVEEVNSEKDNENRMNIVRPQKNPNFYDVYEILQSNSEKELKNEISHNELPFLSFLEDYQSSLAFLNRFESF